MKKTVSLFLALLLLLSLTGCGAPAPIETTAPPPTATSVSDAVAQILIPDLVGKSVYDLKKTDSYILEETESVVSDLPAGTILSQEPEKGTFADFGCTVYVTVSAGDGTQEPSLPPQTDPPKEPSEPNRPEQTDPDIPELPTDPQITEPSATQPPQTDPPQTDPPQTNPPQTNPPQTDPPQTDPPQTDPPLLDKNGSYTTKKDVALYLHLYGRLPNNFITKKQAEDRYNWSGGSLSKYGLCIGGDRFYNNEGKLPGGYTYYECDIDTLYSSQRGSKRLVFTYSGIIYYTSDHYKTFTRLY